MITRKCFYLFSLLLALLIFGTKSIQGGAVIRRIQAITLAIREPATLVAEPSHLAISMAYEPGPGYQREWYSNKWPFPTSYHCESPTRKIRRLIPAGERKKNPARLRLPLGYFATWNSSLDNDVKPDPTLPLPAGSWSCWIERDVTLVKTNGKSVKILLESNRVSITILEPSDDDRIVLQQSGLWDKLMMVDDSGAPWPAIDFYSFSTIIRTHPRSGYYCKFIAAEFRQKFLYVINTRDEKERLYWSVRTDTADRCKYDYSFITDLERFSCTWAAPDELAAWKVRQQLCMENLAAAQRLSRRALRAHPRPELANYFQWTVNLTATDIAKAWHY